MTNLRVVSMVPSWTETLVACGVNVVGRTRFCIHPEATRAIPAIGGTKDINWDKLKVLRPDLLILDREENPKSMSDEAPCETFASRIHGLKDVAAELDRLAQRFSESFPDQKAAANLSELADRWRALDSLPQRQMSDWNEMSGILEWLSRPSGFPVISDRTNIVYMIWKNPWMAAGPGTFISSVFERLGWPTEKLWPGIVGQSSKTKYPELSLADLPSESVLLFSSEPYPFFKKKEEIEALGFPSALIDGESMSWFGLRSLLFLENALKNR